MDYDELVNDLAIAPFDTSKNIKLNMRDIAEELMDIKEKMNEIIEVINILTMPDDPDLLNEEDDDEDDEIVIGTPVKSTN